MKLLSLTIQIKNKTKQYIGFSSVCVLYTKRIKTREGPGSLQVGTALLTEKFLRDILCKNDCPCHESKLRQRKETKDE